MRLIAIITGLLSLSAWGACPQIAGAYKTCRSTSVLNSGSNDMVIEQKVVNRIMNYTFKAVDIESGERITDSYKADGKTKIVSRTDPDSGLSMKTETTATCVGDVLNIKVNAFIQNEAFARIVMNISKDGHQLIQETTGESLGEPVNDTLICE